MCNKESYPSQEAARNAAHGMARGKKGSYREYYCEDPCGAWHISSNGKRRAHRNHERGKREKYPFRFMPCNRKPKKR